MSAITKDRLLTIKQWRETYGPGTTTLKTHLESVVKTILSKLIKNAKATKKANLFIHI